MPDVIRYRSLQTCKRVFTYPDVFNIDLAAVNPIQYQIVSQESAVEQCLYLLYAVVDADYGGFACRCAILYQRVVVSESATDMIVKRRMVRTRSTDYSAPKERHIGPSYRKIESYSHQTHGCHINIRGNG